ncbi:MAG: C-GCAxxG-C-C family (seleno)protein [Sedimentisphaeraceae bacterium JB056]
MEQRAKSLFHGVEKYNCAQAIVAAFKEKYNVSQDVIDEFKAFGGGRAEEGLCGALYAGLHLAGGDLVKDELRNVFMEKAGCLTCKGIKKGSKMPCSECVGLAAATLEKHS